MKAYQVHKGDENKHGFQEYELVKTFLNKEKAEQFAKEMVEATPLHGDILHEEEWSKDGKYKSWTAQGWGFVCICRIEEIDIEE
jgi:hypothetical protein